MVNCYKTPIKDVMNMKKSKAAKKDNPHREHRMRMKARFLNEGISGFEDHNILELLLFFGIPFKDTNEIAHELITKFGSINKVFEADYDQIKSVKNMTHNATTLIKLIPELCSKYNLNNIKSSGITLGSPEFEEYMKEKYRTLTKETVILYIFDKNGMLFSDRVIADGSRVSSSIDLRKVVEETLAKKASVIVLSHNHPDGIKSVSQFDTANTLRLHHLLYAVGIELFEHYVVSEDCVSGILKTARPE